MIRITPAISIDESLIQEQFVRASGPGGQNVNKLSTAVQLRFDAARANLPPDVRDRLARLAGSRMTDDGTLIIEAREFRHRQRNRQAAMDRLVDLLTRAATRPKRRRPTRPTKASQARRVESKRRRSQIKQSRQPPGEQP